MGKDVTSDHMLDSLRLAVKDIVDKQSEPLVLQPRIEIRPYPPHPGGPIISSDPDDYAVDDWPSSSAAGFVTKGGGVKAPDKDYFTAQWDIVTNKRRVPKGRPHKNYLIEE